MEDLTMIKGVLGYCLYQADSPVSDGQGGKLGDKVSEIEQFWSSASSVIAGNLKMSQVSELVVSGKDRLVLLMMKDDKLLLCELEPKADWRAVAAEAGKKV
jgi:predicted regulator of Ras-like GTPase activity (Roadblock/LC7/MglB family)